MAATFHILSIVCIVLGILFFLTAIVLFFKLDVIALIGEVSGKTAEKQVQAIREQSKKTANRRRDDVNASFDRSSNQVARQLYDGNALRGKSGALNNRPLVQTVEATVPLGSAVWTKTDRLSNGEATTVLSDSEATTLLSDLEATTVLSDMEVTTVLSDSEATTVLSNPVSVHMLDEVSEIHTREVIDI